MTDHSRQQVRRDQRWFIKVFDAAGNRVAEAWSNPSREAAQEVVNGIPDGCTALVIIGVDTVGRTVDDSKRIQWEGQV